MPHFVKAELADPRREAKVAELAARVRPRDPRMDAIVKAVSKSPAFSIENVCEAVEAAARIAKAKAGAKV